MKNSVVLIGVGEMGGVFARGFLRAGYTVIPARRGDDLKQLAEKHPNPALVLLAVAEKDLHTGIASIPAAWKARLALLQNELLPSDWQQHGYDNPTVISVWFEKKPGKDAKVIQASPTFGPHAQILHDALAAIGIPAKIVGDADALLFELVLKNVYILTTNIAGLAVGGTVGELWNQHRDLAKRVAHDVIQIQEHLCGGTHFDAHALIEGMVAAFNGDLEHQCMGRSALARLQRALEIADQATLAVPTLREIENAS